MSMTSSIFEKLILVVLPILWGLTIALFLHSNNKNRHTDKMKQHNFTIH